MIILFLNVQEEDIIEHINGKCQVFTVSNARGRYSSTYECQVSFVHILVNLSQPFCNLGHTSHDIIKHTHAKILASVLERLMS